MIVVPQLFEMHELAGDAPEIFPHAAEDFPDLGLALLRVGGAQIVEAGSVRGHPWGEGARRLSHKVGTRIGVEFFQPAHRDAHGKR